MRRIEKWNQGTTCLTVLMVGLLTSPATAQPDKGAKESGVIGGKRTPPRVVKIVPDPDPGWTLVADGMQFTDAACSDAEGNFYFCDLRGKSGIRKIAPDGTVSTVTKVVPQISGMAIAPDGRFIACVQGGKKQIVAINPKNDAVEVLAENIQPNDLIVNSKGHVYVTVTGKGEVVLITGPGEARTVATGIDAPNGIALSPYEGTLAVSEYRGTHVWTFLVRNDGSLAAGKRTMKLQSEQERSGGDGSTVDEEGRYYVTSAAGIQIFSANGDPEGTLPNPQDGNTVSVAFAGDSGRFLYACSADKIYRRPLKTRGVRSDRASDKNYRRIFDGKTLDGWKGDPTYWKVENGALVGEVTPDTLLKRNSFIVWQGDMPADFELMVEYRISARGNSGINYRSEKIDGVPHALRGYQADLDGDKRYTGSNYEEQRRTTLAAQGEVSVVPMIDDAADLPRHAKGNQWTPRKVTGSLGLSEFLKGAALDNDWNEYRLIIMGNRLRHVVNGVLMSDVTDNDPVNSRSDGLLGIQVHVGPPMKVEYRNLRMRALESE